MWSGRDHRRCGEVDPSSATKREMRVDLVARYVTLGDQRFADLVHGCCFEECARGHRDPLARGIPSTPPEMAFAGVKEIFGGLLGLLIGAPWCERADQAPRRTGRTCRAWLWHALCFIAGQVDPRKEVCMRPLFLWFLGVPVWLIILLMLLGVVRF